MLVDHQFEDAPRGTCVSVRDRGGSGLLFTLCVPLVARMVKSRVEGDSAH